MQNQRVCIDAMLHYLAEGDLLHTYARLPELVVLQLDIAYDTVFAFPSAERVEQNQTLECKENYPKLANMYPYKPNIP